MFETNPTFQVNSKVRESMEYDCHIFSKNLVFQMKNLVFQSKYLVFRSKTLDFHRNIRYIEILGISNQKFRNIRFFIP